MVCLSLSDGNLIGNLWYTLTVAGFLENHQKLNHLSCGFYHANFVLFNKRTSCKMAICVYVFCAVIMIELQVEKTQNFSEIHISSKKMDVIVTEA